MSGHIGLREDAQVGHKLALMIAALFPRCETAVSAVGCAVRTTGKRGLFALHGTAEGEASTDTLRTPDGAGEVHTA
jgi:hypothetical protein